MTMQRILAAEYPEKGALDLALFSWNASWSQSLKVNTYTAAIIVNEYWLMAAAPPAFGGFRTAEGETAVCAVFMYLHE